MPYNFATHENLSSREELIYTNVIGWSRALLPMLFGGLAMESLTELKLFTDEIPEVCSRASESSLNKLQTETRTGAQTLSGLIGQSATIGEEKLPWPSLIHPLRGISVINYEVAFCCSRSGRWIDPSVSPQLTHALKRI